MCVNSLLIKMAGKEEITVEKLIKDNLAIGYPIRTAEDKYVVLLKDEIGDVVALVFEYNIASQKYELSDVIKS